METLTFNLPYKVKMIENKSINFSIVLLLKNDENKISRLLSKLENFKNFGGEVYILDIGSTDNTINISREWGCKIEDGTSFSRIIDDEMSNFINDKFDFDKKENGIVKNGDIYFDYSEAKNYAASRASNKMILMLENDSNIIDLNIENIITHINNGYDTINPDNKNVSFYNREKFNWTNIIFE